MIKFLHAADFHLDSPFAGLSSDKAAARRAEQRDVLEQVLELAQSEGVQVIFLAGDLLDGEGTYFDTVDLLRLLLGRTSAKVFISPGNHDFFGPGSVYATIRWPDNVHIFSSAEITRVDVPELDLSVYGAGFSSAFCGTPLLKGFTVDGDCLSNKVMVLHGDLGQPDSRYNPVDKQDIAASGLDYLALGHTHSFDGFTGAGATKYAYSGCPMGRGFDECGEKGVIIGSLDRGSKGLGFVPLNVRRYEIAKIELTGSEDPFIEIENALPKRVLGSICRVILTGLYKGKELDVGRLHSRLEDRFHNLSFIDRTRPARPLWEGIGDDTLRGLFLQNMKVRYDEAESDSEKETMALAVRYGLAAIENAEVPVN